MARARAISVGVAGRDNRFGLRRLRYQPDGNDRHANGGFDGARKWHLIARSDQDLLRRVKTAAGDMDRIAAAGVEQSWQRQRSRQRSDRPRPNP